MEHEPNLIEELDVAPTPVAPAPPRRALLAIGLLAALVGYGFVSATTEPESLDAVQAPVVESTPGHFPAAPSGSIIHKPAEGPRSEGQWGHDSRPSGRDGPADDRAVVPGGPEADDERWLVHAPDRLVRRRRVEGDKTVTSAPANPDCEPDVLSSETLSALQPSHKGPPAPHLPDRPLRATIPREGGR